MPQNLSCFNIVISIKLSATLTNCVPENHLEELVYKQITCSPGVCDVNVHLPSLL